MKKYIQPTLEVFEMEGQNSIMNTSAGTFDFKGELQDTQSVLSGRRRSDAWSDYEDR
jgi:hypothetical protein